MKKFMRIALSFVASLSILSSTAFAAEPNATPASAKKPPIWKTDPDFAQKEIPVSWNPIEATDKEIKDYGLPKRPDRAKDPERYEEWKKHVSAKLVDPRIQETPN